MTEPGSARCFGCGEYLSPARIVREQPAGRLWCASCVRWLDRPAPEPAEEERPRLALSDPRVKYRRRGKRGRRPH